MNAIDVFAAAMTEQRPAWERGVFTVRAILEGDGWRLWYSTAPREREERFFGAYEVSGSAVAACDVSTGDGGALLALLIRGARVARRSALWEQRLWRRRCTWPGQRATTARPWRSPSAPTAAASCTR